MLTALSIIILVLITICSIIDWRVKAVPSVFLTSIILISLIINPGNLIFGLMAFVFGWLLFDFDYIRGIGDIKIMAVIGLMISDIYFIFMFMILTTIFGMAWKLIVKLRYKNEDEFAFIPVLLFTYITLMILGGVA